MKSIVKTVTEIIPGIIGGGLFLFFAFVLNFNFIVSIIIGLVAFVASLFIFTNKEDALEMIADGITAQQYKEILETGLKKYEILKGFIKKIHTKEVKQKVIDICAIVEKIFDDLHKDPKDIRVAKQFLSYYLDTTVNILNRYTDITNQSLQSKKFDDTLKKVEGLLDTIKVAFEKQLEKLYNDDLLDLDTEVKVLEQTMKSESIE